MNPNLRNNPIISDNKAWGKYDENEELGKKRNNGDMI